MINRDYTKLRGANLHNTNSRLSNSTLAQTKFTGADLQNANLQYADLRKAKLAGANLSGADLRNANLTNTNLQYTILRGADLTDADLTGANIADTFIANCIGDQIRIRNVPSPPSLWRVVYTTTTLAIGPHQCPITEWAAFTYDQLTAIDPHIRDWWMENRTYVLNYIGEHSCT